MVKFSHRECLMILKRVSTMTDSSFSTEPVSFVNKKYGNLIVSNYLETKEGHHKNQVLHTDTVRLDR